MSEDTTAAEAAAEESMSESESPKPEKLLIIDDDKNMSALISRILRGFNYEVEVEHDPRQTLDRLSEGGFALALVDIVMPHMGGIELVIRIKNDHPTLPVVVMTSFGSIKTARRAVQAGADDFVTKTSEGEFWDLRLRKVLDSR